ncbi:MAG: hypothetical protein KDI79_12925 [Anaerolineae bacterium]|nr:hypothetical protein [Anaerolineae bacterium]
MSNQEVTLHLPETVMQRAKDAADALQRPIEEILTAVLTAALPDLADVPSEMHSDLAQMTWLSDTDLWAIAHSTLSDDRQIQLQQLAELQGRQELTEQEHATLESLRQDYGQVTLRKARAYALLSLRAGQPLLADE